MRLGQVQTCMGQVPDIPGDARDRQASLEQRQGLLPPPGTQERHAPIRERSGTSRDVAAVKLGLKALSVPLRGVPELALFVGEDTQVRPGDGDAPPVAEGYVLPEGSLQPVACVPEPAIAGAPD